MLQMPVVCVKPRRCSTWFLCERVEGVDYVKFLSLTNALLNVEGGVANASPSIGKSELYAILTLAQSDQECQLIRYSVFKASGMTYTGARKHFGFQNIKTTERRVLNAIEEAGGICEAIFDLCHIADSALLLSMGIEVPHDTESESDSSAEVDTTDLPCEEELLKILEATKYNWFEVLQHVESNSSACITENPHIIAFLGKMFNSIMSNVSDPESKRLLEQSYNASVSALELQERENRISSAINGDIVSESESDTAVVSNISSPEVKGLVAKKRRYLLQKFRRRKARLIAEQRYLSRSTSNTILDKHPNIGSDIESFVRSCDIGADRWRRTGVLTFDGNIRVRKKVTFGRIKEHLESLYGEKISYGTLVQFCVAPKQAASLC